MTFLQDLENKMLKRFSFGKTMEDGLHDILDTFKTFGSYLNQITNYDQEHLDDFLDIIYDYHIIKRDYQDFHNGDDSMVFPQRDENKTPGKTRINQNISTLKKARDLLKYVSNKDFRVMQGNHRHFEENENFIPTVPMEWQTKKDGSQKYKNTEQYSFTNYQDKEVALKAFNQTIALYSEAKKYPFDFQYRVEKDIFNTYWFLTALIQDLEKKEFYLFEKSEYYNPEKPSKKQLKYFLQFLRLEYKIKASHDEKQLIDNL
jgi:hypothetical protein